MVIPTRNEAANLPWVLDRMPPWVHEVIVVDGLSTDGTVEAARRCRPDVLVVHERRPGKGVAMRSGFGAASGEVIVVMDADGSMDPVEIGLFVEAIEGGADLAKGSRRLPGGGSSDITMVRSVGNQVLLGAANLLLGTRHTELCYGYMALRRSRVPHLALTSDGFEIETEIGERAERAGLAVTEVPSFEAPRRTGASNLHAVRDGLRIVRTLLQVRFMVRRRTAR